MREAYGQFLRFGMVGTLGFIVDAGTLQLLVSFKDLNPYEGRIVSYLIAATITWSLNRRFTFPRHDHVKAHHQWLHYLLVNGVGASLNYGIYSLLVYLSTFAYHHLYLAVLAGAMAGIFFNFNLSRRWVFGPA
jgi:putative flippase GtrA